MNQEVNTIIEPIILDEFRSKHLPELYEPIRYILSLGGKRLRPNLVLLAAGLFSDDWKKFIQPAIAVELFHNFTLIHDDIMDRAPLRRGQSTIHEKWNTNIALLSGDVMLIHAYQKLLELPPSLLPILLSKFNQCAIDVCEGQQMDMNFENTEKVNASAYIEMITKKTAVLLGFALEYGALIGGADEKQATLLRKIGIQAGIGFQLKDDILDVYADQNKFGKTQGGDIIANKKTFLLITALEKAEGSTLSELQYWLNLSEFKAEEKVQAVKSIYDQLEVKTTSEALMTSYFDQARQSLENLTVEKTKKSVLSDYLQALMGREK